MRLAHFIPIFPLPLRLVSPSIALCQAARLSNIIKSQMNEKSQLKYKMIRFTLLLHVSDLIMNGLLLHTIPRGQNDGIKTCSSIVLAQLTLILNNANQ